MEESLKKFVLYTAPTGEIRVDVLLQDESVWLTQKAIAELFGVVKSTVSEHLTNIYTTHELEETSTVRKIRTVQTEGNRTVNRDLDYYNLDAIISVGYRVNSAKATQFRIWATQALKEYIIKGFVLDDDRLKQGQAIFGKDYFRELLERIRSIRASERRIWQQITDIFAECSIDYDKNSDITKEFYATVQNKFHYAITNKTAAEIVFNSADRTKENMGLMTWKNSPDGRILVSDVTVAKNYLDENSIKRLENVITGYFDYIEDLVNRGKVFTMENFAESINRFLEFREYKILSGKGSIRKETAEKKARLEYDEFNKTQKINSDFDKEIKKLLKSEN